MIATIIGCALVVLALCLAACFGSLLADTRYERDSKTKEQYQNWALGFFIGVFVFAIAGLLLVGVG